MVEKIARDRRLRRRALPILGALVLLVCIFAAWRESGRTRTAAMSQQEASTYGVLTAEELLPCCTLESTGTTGNGGAPPEPASYSSQVLPGWLPDCRALREISRLGELLYIVYDTEGGRQVWLTYGAAGLMEQLVYEPDTDTLYQPVTGEKTFHFRHGTS